MIASKIPLRFAAAVCLLACAHPAKAPLDQATATKPASTAAPALAAPLAVNADALPACAPRTQRVGMCVLKLNADDNFSNDDPARAGAIVAMGEARPECFGASNWGRAVPITLDKDKPPSVPEGTLWLRMKDPSHGELLIGLAAPGLPQLGVRVGDEAALHWPISLGGEWGRGTSELRIEGRGRVQIVLNDLEAHGLSFGPAACRREGFCGGVDHALERKADGQASLLAPLANARWQAQVFTNAETFEHGPDFRATEEGYTGPVGCQGQKRASLVAIVTPE
jgi:hypothetical protein